MIKKMMLIAVVGILGLIYYWHDQCDVWRAINENQEGVLSTLEIQQGILEGQNAQLRRERTTMKAVSTLQDAYIAELEEEVKGTIDLFPGYGDDEWGNRTIFIRKE